MKTISEDLNVWNPKRLSIYLGSEVA